MSTLKARFCAKYHQGGPDDCWEWQAATDKDGYGRILSRSGGKVLRAHRLAYEFHHRVSLDESVMILHTCDNPPCCNPRHLVAGTQQDNIQDMIDKGRMNTAKLTEDDVRRMCKERSKGRTLSSLSDEFGVSQATVCRRTK